MTSVRERIAMRNEWRRRRRRGFRSLSTPLIGWLQLSTAGMLHPGQYALLDRAVAEMPAGGAVVEIGSWTGLSTNTIAHLLARHGREHRFVSTDPWEFERSDEGLDAIPGSSVTFGALRDHVRAQFVANTQLWSGDRLPNAVELSSDDFFAAWNAGADVEDVFGRRVRLGGPIAFAFIDGDHRLEQARRDFENVDRHLLASGLVLLDDSDRFGAWPHLWRLGQDAARSGAYDLVDENPSLLLRKR